VVAERGLSARWRFRRIVRLGWPPCVRLNTGGPCRPAPQAVYRPLASFVPQPGTRWPGTGTAFKSPQRPPRCPLLACGEPGSTAPWGPLTDVPPDASEACGYGVRAWIAPGFNVTNRAGWPWQRPCMPAPQRAARLWLTVAVATRWRLRVGGAADAMSPDSPLLEVSVALAGQRRPRRATRLRLVSTFRRGWLIILVAWLNQAPRPLGGVLPAPWPTGPEFGCDISVTEWGVRPHATA
jgi:hypothetical protein